MSVCYSFFSLIAACQKEFTFLFIRRPVLVSFKLELSFQFIFEKSSTKRVVQQNDAIKCLSFAPMVKSSKALHANLLKSALYYSIFQGTWLQVQNSDMEI